MCLSRLFQSGGSEDVLQLLEDGWAKEDGTAPGDQDGLIIIAWKDEYSSQCVTYQVVLLDS